MIDMRNTVLIFLLLVMAPMIFNPNQSTYVPQFNGDLAYESLVAQCDIGPRPPGSDNLTACRVYIVAELELLGWSVELQNFTYKDTSCSNIIATWTTQNPEHFILGAHYDTRPHADQEPAPVNRTIPVLGANDAASGVAVLLELARVLPEDIRSSVEMVFFDAEDSGNLDGWDWIVGSNYYVDQLSDDVKANVSGMILLDMIGGTDLVVPRERYSTREMQDDIWDVAESLNDNDVFVDTVGSPVIDDHRPFLDAGIPAVDLIQTPFPWTWHTQYDTPENCDPESLQTIGEVVETYLVTSSSSSYTVTPSIDYFVVLLIVIPIITIISCIFYRRKRILHTF